MEFPSKILENAVKSISTLPGIGKKTALRLALHLIYDQNGKAELLSQSLIDLKSKINFCSSCHTISDEYLCHICTSQSRNKKVICVVESVRDLLAIEDTGQFSGMYHVLGGVISPLDGIGPEELNIDSLISRIQLGYVEELIMALSPTIEGDTTIFYITRKLNQPDLRISTIARGVSFGGDLEYADEITLGRSILSRVPYAGND
jgi:recombination protein RecR